MKRIPSKSDPRDLRLLRHLFRVNRGHDLTSNITTTMTNTMTKTKAVAKTNYWLVTFETLITIVTIENLAEFMTISFTWQLIVTLDSIRNSCNVLWHSYMAFFFGNFLYAYISITNHAKYSRRLNQKHQQLSFVALNMNKAQPFIKAKLV